MGPRTKPNPLAMDKFLQPAGPEGSGKAGTPHGAGPVTFAKTKYVDELRGDFKAFRSTVPPRNVLDNASDTPLSMQVVPATHPLEDKKPATLVRNVYQDALFDAPPGTVDKARQGKDRALRLDPPVVVGGRVTYPTYREGPEVIADDAQFLKSASQRRAEQDEEVRQRRAQAALREARRKENRLAAVVSRRHPNGFLGGEAAAGGGTTPSDSLYSGEAERRQQLQDRAAAGARKRQEFIIDSENKKGSGGPAMLAHTDAPAPAEKLGYSGGWKFTQSKGRCAPPDTFCMSSMHDQSRPRPTEIRRKLLAYNDNHGRHFDPISGTKVEPQSVPF